MKFYTFITGTSSQDLGACENTGQWRDNSQDSSGSDQPECEDDEQQTRSLDTKPCFILGEDVCDIKQIQQNIPSSDTVLKSYNPDESQSKFEQVVSITIFWYLLDFILIAIMYTIM